MVALNLSVNPVHVDPLFATTTSGLTAITDSKLHVDPLALALHVDPLEVKTASALDTNSALKAEVDFKPLQVDLCLKLGLDRLPSTGICRDGRRHFGITLLGVEVIGFNYDMDSKTVIEDLANRPFVVGGRRPDHHPGIGAPGIRIHVGD